jgi:hypothetical protein
LTIDESFRELGLSNNAKQPDVTKAYRKLALLYHPDKNKEAAATDKFKVINEANENLVDYFFKESNPQFAQSDEMPQYSQEQYAQKIDELTTAINQLQQKPDIATEILQNARGPLINLAAGTFTQYVGNKAFPEIFESKPSPELILHSVKKIGINSVVPKICNVFISNIQGQIGCQIVSTIGSNILMDNSLEQSMIASQKKEANDDFDKELLKIKMNQLQNQVNIPSDIKLRINRLIDIIQYTISEKSDKYTFNINPQKSGMIIFLDRKKRMKI